MIDDNEIQGLAGIDVYSDIDGDKIGQVGAVFIDETGQAGFAAVLMGLLRIDESLVPLDQATVTPKGLLVPFSTDQVKQAPSISSDARQLTRATEQALRRHYNVD